MRVRMAAASVAGQEPEEDCSDEIEARAMHEDAEVLFHKGTDHAAKKEGADIKEKPIETAAEGAGGAVHGGEGEDERVEADGEEAEDENDVGRAADFHVEAVGVVPPVVEGGGDDHGDASPGGDEGSERAAESPEAHRGVTQ